MNRPLLTKSKQKCNQILFIFSVKTIVPLWDGLWSATQEKYRNTSKKVGIFWVLVKCFWPTFLLGALYQLVYVLLQFASPQILGLIISFVQGDDPDWKGYFYTILFAIVAFLSAISDSSYWYNMRLVGLRLRTALSSSIYKKSLRLSNASRKAHTGTFS
jgi:ABC-type bacteriocin/lantibiotic exporter with double-glycine peptidase domain